MVVGDVIEEVDFLLLEEECGGDGVHGSISPAFVKESTIFVKSIEVIQIGWRSQPVEVSNFEIRPLIVPSMLAQWLGGQAVSKNLRSGNGYRFRPYHHSANLSHYPQLCGLGVFS